MRMKGQMRGECCRHEYRGAVGAKRGRGGLTRSGSRSECCRHDTGGTVGHESDRGGANAVLLGRLRKVDLIILEGKNVCPSVRPSVRPSVHKKFLQFE